MYQHNAELARSARNLLADGGLAELIRAMESTDRDRRALLRLYSEKDYGHLIKADELFTAIDRAREGK